MQNKAVHHESAIRTDTDVEEQLPHTKSDTPQLHDRQTTQQTLLHDSDKVEPHLEKPHVRTAPQYVVSSDADPNSPHSLLSTSRGDDTASGATRPHQGAKEKTSAELDSSPVPNGSNISPEDRKAASARSTGLTAGKLAESELGTERKESRSIDVAVSDAFLKGDVELLKQLLNQGAKPANDALLCQSYEAKRTFHLLASSEDIETLHKLVAHTTPETKAYIMDEMLGYLFHNQMPTLMEYLARHAVINRDAVEAAMSDRSNTKYQALLDSGMSFTGDLDPSTILRDTFRFSYQERLASLPKKRSTAAQAFDAHRDRKYKEADNLFNLPAPTDNNPLGLTENALENFSELGLHFLYHRLQHTHAGLISTMPDSLLRDGFRSEIVWILRSCQKECTATREALMRKMNAHEYRIACKTVDGDIVPCNGKKVEQLLFAFQLSTHERLLQIAQPPLTEKANIFQTIQSEISSFLNWDKNAQARTAQAKVVIELAQGVPEFILQLPQEILDIKTGVAEKRVSAKSALESLQKHQETLETQFEALMGSPSPGTDLADQVIINMYGNTFKELAAIRKATLSSAGQSQSQ